MVRAGALGLDKNLYSIYIYARFSLCHSHYSEQHTFLITSFLRVPLIALSLLLQRTLTRFTWCVGWVSSHIVSLFFTSQFLPFTLSPNELNFFSLAGLVVFSSSHIAHKLSLRCDEKKNGELWTIFVFFCKLEINYSNKNIYHFVATAKWRFEKRTP